MKINITYMSGAGNLFSVINNAEYRFSESELKRLAPILCSKNKYNPNRTEGFLVINTSKDKDTEFDVQFYNPDGSKDAMCGNGGRCAVSYAIKHRFLVSSDYTEIKFSMAGETYKSKKNGDLIKLFFPPPKAVKTNIQIGLDDMTIFGDYIDVGSRHFVIPRNNISSYANLDITTIDFVEFVKPIRNYSKFQPQGINVSIYQYMSNNSIKYRTFERGVEAETGACGTGAISVAISAVGRGKVHFPVTLIPPSEEKLIVDIEGQFPDKIISLSLEGSAEVLDEYVVEIPRDIVLSELLD